MSLHVAFRVGTADYVISADEVLHLESFTEATHIPGAPSFVTGLVQVRGRLVPVVDLRVRFGLSPIERTLDTRVIVVKLGARVAGLLIDSARDVLKIDPQSYEPPPDLVGSQAAGFVKAVTSVAKRLMLVVDVPRVIGEEMPHA